MHSPTDHFLLYTEAIRSDGCDARWKFVLQSVAGNEKLAAEDSELNSRTSRMELLAVVRGLEAIDRPARVTLLTDSRYVSRGIKRQLNQWREDNWQWERFGELVPIRDRDLWQRVDRALSFHRLECCAYSADDRATQAHESHSAGANSGAGAFLAAALATLRRGVLTPFSAILGPPFTRAA
jgi:ribonuclease HI